MLKIILTLLFLFLPILFILPGDTSAACPSTLSCCKQYIKSCSGGLNSGDECFSNSDCFGGTCQETSECKAREEFSCDDQCNFYIPQICKGDIQGNCSPSTGGGNPSPSPSASSGTGDGTWGNCGSCSPCYGADGVTRGPDSQCVLDPYGACLWDAGRCTYTGPSCDWCFHCETLGQCRGRGVPYDSSNPLPCCEPLVGDAGGGCNCPACGDGVCSTNAGENSTNCAPDCCVASCPVQCGQQDGCGGYCGNTDSGAPATPTLNPANGGTVIASGTTATVQWNSVSKADWYEIDLYPQGSNCTAHPTHCGKITTSPSYTFSIISGYNRYTYRVRAVNFTCSNQPGSWAGPANFLVAANVTGRFYEDLNQQAALSGTTCTLGGATAISPGTGASITSGAYNGIISSINYWVTVPYWPASWGNPNHVVTLTPGTNGSGVTYECTCPNGCSYSGIASPQTGVNFYLIPDNLIAESWFQVAGGNIYAGQATGTSVYSPVPDETYCDGTTCTPRVLIQDLDDTTDTAGIALTGGGAIDTQRDTDNQQTHLSQRDPQLYVTGSSLTRFNENYNYFAKNFATQALPDPSTTPAGLTNGQAYVQNGDLTIDDPWSVPSGQTVIVFVNGSLTIADPTNANQLIQVEDGGFLAFIVSGNITIDENLGNETLTDTTPNLEGIYFANNTLTVESRGADAGGDDRFVGAGSFIGLQNVDLQRDFTSTADPTRQQNMQTISTELFIYRPDLLRNIPEALTNPRYIWQETN